MKTGTKRRRRIERWDINKLKPHPKQEAFFNDLPDHELRQLADDLERNGQQLPVEVTNDGYIIAGHQRVRAAQLLDWETIRVWVRDDLKDDESIERRFLEDNLHRRQMSNLEKARCYLRIKELERGRESSRCRSRGDLRDCLAKGFGVSGRTLDRWTRILQAPIEVQRAYESGKLGVADAGRVADVNEETQQLIAEQIRAGHNPKQVVARHAPQRRHVYKPKGPKVGKILEQMEAFVDELNTDLDTTKGRLNTDDLPTLRKVHECVLEMVEYIEANAEECLPFETKVEQLADKYVGAAG